MYCTRHWNRRIFDVTRPEAADHNMAALDTGRAVAAIRQMRLRFKRPEKAAETLLLEMEADGLIETVDPVREHINYSPIIPCKKIIFSDMRAFRHS